MSKKHTTEAQRAASKRYYEKNKARKMYTTVRAKGLKYINEYSNLEDLDYFEELANKAALNL